MANPLFNKPHKEYDEKDWDEEWNELHKKYVKEEMKNAIEGESECGKFKTFSAPPEMQGYRNKKMADYLEEIILMAKKEYYTTGEPIMEDYRYDKMEKYLEMLRPESDVLKKVGYEIKKDV